MQRLRVLVFVCFLVGYVQMITQLHKCPTVMIVIQGGPGTMASALKAVQERTPLVVVDGSGKAATAISYAWRYLHSDEFVGGCNVSLTDTARKIGPSHMTSLFVCL